jgi:hypothetical protein
MRIPIREKEKGIPLKICSGFSKIFTPVWRAPANSVVAMVTMNRMIFIVIFCFPPADPSQRGLMLVLASQNSLRFILVKLPSLK